MLVSFSMRALTTRLAVLTWAGILAACGGGGGTDGNSRSGITLSKPLTASAAAVAPGEPVTYEVLCTGGQGDFNYKWALSGVVVQPTASAIRHTVAEGYANEGKYRAEVTCTDARGNTLSSSTQVYVAVPQHSVRTIDVTTTNPGATHTEATFTAQCAGTSGNTDLVYEWDFGDASARVTGQRVTHAYVNAPARAYTATLRCTEIQRLDAGTVRLPQTVSSTTTVNIGSPATAQITQALIISPGIPTTAGPTTFSITCSGSPTYAFDFGDGSAPVTGNTTGTVTHTYSGSQTQQYTVRVACGQGTGDAVTTRTINVRSPKMTTLMGVPGGGLDLGFVAVDASGNVFASTGGSLLKVSSGTYGTSVTTVLRVGGATSHFPVAADGLGSVYFGGYKISPSGVVTPWGDPSFTSLAAAADGTLYGVTGALIKKVSPTGEISTWVDTATTPQLVLGTGFGRSSADDQRGIGVDREGQVYVLNASGRVFKINPTGEVGAEPVGADRYSAIAVDTTGAIYGTTYASVKQLDPRSGLTTAIVASVGTTTGHIDGGPGTASFIRLVAIAITPQGSLILADGNNEAIRKVAPDGWVSTIAGGGISSWELLENGSDQLSYEPKKYTVAADRHGSTFVASKYERIIKKIDPSGAVSVFAGSGADGSSDGPASTASFRSPGGLVIDSAGVLYVMDGSLTSIRKVNTNGVVSTLTFQLPASEGAIRGIAVDDNGHAFAAGNAAIYKITSAGAVSVFAEGESARAITVDRSGNIFIVYGEGKVRKYAPDGSAREIADLGFESRRIFNLAADDEGAIYLANPHQQVIQKISPTGAISTVAGVPGTLGPTDFVPGPLPASFDHPFYVAVAGRRLVFAGTDYVAQIDFVP